VGKNEAAADLAEAFSGTAAELVVAGLVVGKDATCPEGPIRNRGVKDV
jgi:hypothetical protein